MLNHLYATIRKIAFYQNGEPASNTLTEQIALSIAQMAQASDDCYFADRDQRAQTKNTLQRTVQEFRNLMHQAGNSLTEQQLNFLSSVFAKNRGMIGKCMNSDQVEALWGLIQGESDIY